MKEFERLGEFSGGNLQVYGGSSKEERKKADLL
jgi:hypothetical protein